MHLMHHFSVLWKCRKLVDNIKGTFFLLHILYLRKQNAKKEEYKVSLVYENRKPCVKKILLYTQLLHTRP